MARLLATHEVTWAYQDSFCANQYAFPEQPEEFPSMPVKTVIIAIFKIKAYSRMNGTNLHSPVELQPEMHAESHLEEHPMSLL